MVSPEKLVEIRSSYWRAGKHTLQAAAPVAQVEEQAERAVLPVAVM